VVLVADKQETSRIGTRSAVLLAQAEESLRQQRLMADEKIARARAIRRLQVAAGWTVVLLLPAIATACFAIIWNHDKMPGDVLTMASAALFVDVLGLLITAYKSMVVRKSPEEVLAPVTESPIFNNRNGIVSK
jgi:ABC-type transport system involved in cytochrome c biogenesis permease component